jgi:hypothetical protein
MLSASQYNTAALQVVSFESVDSWGIVGRFFRQVGANHTHNGSAISSICLALVLCPNGHVVNLRWASGACIRSKRSDISSIKINSILNIKLYISQK